MFPLLATAIDSLDIPVGGDALAAALALRDRLDARLAAAVEAFDQAGLWDGEGATSVTAWLADRARMTRPRAAATARNARLVARLPSTAAAWADGRLSSGQVEAICANLSPGLVDLFAHSTSPRCCPTCTRSAPPTSARRCGPGAATQTTLRPSPSGPRPCMPHRCSTGRSPSRGHSAPRRVSCS